MGTFRTNLVVIRSEGEIALTLFVDPHRPQKLGRALADRDLAHLLAHGVVETRFWTVHNLFKSAKTTVVLFTYL